MLNNEIITEMREEETTIAWVKRIVNDNPLIFREELKDVIKYAIQFEKEQIVQAYEDGKKAVAGSNGDSYYNNKYPESV